MSDNYTAGFDEQERAAPQSPYAMPHAVNAPPLATRTDQLPAPDYGDETGFEGTTMEEQVTPFLRIAQSGNPELKPGNGKFIPGLTQSMLFNTATKEFYPGDRGVQAIVCYKEYAYGAWIPRDLDGGGFRGMLPLTDPIVRDALQRAAEKHGKSARFNLPRYNSEERRWTAEPPRLADGTEVELVETAQLYALYAGPDEQLTTATAQRAIISMTSTALKPYSNWVSAYTMKKTLMWWSNGVPVTPRMWDFKWNFSTFLQNKDGFDFYNWRISMLPAGALMRDAPAQYGAVDRELYEMAYDFFKLARSGGVKVDEGARDAGTDGDDIPF